MFMSADTTHAVADPKNNASQDGPKPDVSGDNERQSSMLVLRKVTPYLWPENMPWVRRRVVWAMVALFVSKVVSVITPFFYRDAVDALAGGGVPMVALGAIGLTVAYGVARLMNVGFQQLRDVIFARVGQRALRMLALETFEHIHRLSMRYHITRKTGGLSRIIERGVKGVGFCCSASDR
jgi:ABC-type multidrug transport system fused ATPase/permease subunit